MGVGPYAGKEDGLLTIEGAVDRYFLLRYVRYQVNRGQAYLRLSSEYGRP